MWSRILTVPYVNGNVPFCRLGAQSLEKLEATHLGHQKIEYDRIGPALVDGGKGFHAVSGTHGQISERSQGCSHQPQHRLIVIDYKNACAALGTHAGRRHKI